VHVDRVVQVDAGQDGEAVGLVKRHGDLEAVCATATARGASEHAQGHDEPANTVFMVWPAIMLTKRRTEWLIGRTM
jgi:hypothetical protein